MSNSVLIAGIGNIFHGDDAFGVAVAQKLAICDWPDDVCVMDFGIRGMDLAFAFLDGYDLTILVDATARGGAPGTLYTIEPDLDSLLQNADAVCMNSHGLDPAKVLGLAKNMGAQFKRILLVGCEPEVLDTEENGRIGLSEAVQAAIDPAVNMIRKLIEEFRSSHEAFVFATAGEG